MASSLEGVGERRALEGVEPLLKVIELAACPPTEFADRFGELHGQYAEVSGVVAEAVLSRRSGFTKAEIKEMVARANAIVAASPPSASHSQDPNAWEPEELSALWSAPFGQAVGRLSGGSKRFKVPKLPGMLKLGGGRPASNSGDAPVPGMLHTRPRQLSGAL